MVVLKTEGKQSVSQGCCEIDVMFSSDLYIATSVNFRENQES